MKPIPWDCDFIQTDKGRIFRAYAGTKSPDLNTVIIFNPICEESKSSFSIINDFSKKLWNDGWNILRFDYLGTGDSDGDFSKTKAENWINDGLVVINEHIDKNSKFILMGLRLGCNIAFSLSKILPDNLKPSAFVLWEPVLDIGDYIRHLKWTGRKDSDYLDVYSWILSLECLSSIESSLILDTKLVNKPAFLANISGRKTISRKFEKIKSTLEKRSKLIHIRSRPFWELIGQNYCDELILETSNWLNNLYNNE